MYKNVVKRIIDIVLSFVGLVALIPVFVIVAAAIYIDDPGPVVFKQKRVGKDKKLFMFHKFRSMKIDAPNIPTYMLDNPEQYITRIGNFIRKTSIDELPQIYDIFVGNMSIIGPRPPIEGENGLINERDKYGVNAIKPGLTGWAQIHGRDEISVELKSKYDGEYTDVLNKGGFAAFAMDFKCFFGTILKVLKREGIVEGRRIETTEEIESEAVKK